MIPATMAATLLLALNAQGASGQTNKVVSYSTEKVAVFADNGSLIEFRPVGELPEAPFDVIKHDSQDLWGVKADGDVIWMAPMQLNLAAGKRARTVQCTKISTKTGPTSQSSSQDVNATMGSGEDCKKKGEQ